MDSFSYTYIKSPKRVGVQYDKYYCVVARKEVLDGIQRSNVASRPWLESSVVDACTSKYSHTSLVSAPVPSRPRVLKKTRKETNCVTDTHSFVVKHKEINLSLKMKLTAPLITPSLPGPPTPKRRVLVKKRPQPKPNKPRIVKKIEKCYSSDKPYKTTLSGSFLSVITGVRKDIWADPEVTGEYISFLPSLEETKDRNEIFRRQGVVSGYPKRVIPPYKESAFGPPKKKNKWSFSPFREARW